MKVKSKVKKILKPRITFDRIGQIVFTLKEVTKLAFRVRPKLLILVFSINALWGLTSVPNFYLQKLIIDGLISAVGVSNWQPVFYYVVMLVGLTIILSLTRSFLSSFSNFLRRNLSRYFNAELDGLIGGKIAQLDLETIEDPEFRDRFNKVERESGQRAWQLMMPLSNIPNFLVGFISAAGVLVLVSPWVSLGIFIVSLPRILIDSRYIKKEYDLHTQLAPKHRIWGWISYYLRRNRNFMELKILDIPQYLTGKLKDVAEEILQKRYQLSKKRELTGLIGYVPMSIYELSISILLIYWVIIKRITVGSFQLYLQSLRSAEENLSGLVSSLLEIYENYIYVTDLVWFLNLKPVLETKEQRKINPPQDNLRIKFENVWFKYRRDQKWVLKKINFEIEPGEKIALVGENGAGKSTLIKLIAGFYEPQRGIITINDINLNEIVIPAWRKKLAVLFQEFELYPFSVKEAIGYGDYERLKDIEGIKKAAQKTGIDIFIEDLPLKYENPLAPEFEKGVRPSIGQWQRFGISRMLFRKNANIMILDEPTSNVDPEAEEKIFKELVEIIKGKILIFVTQRFSTVRIADRIFVLHEGKLLEQGTHRELMDKKGKYARLFTLQAKSYLEEHGKS